MIEKSGPCAAGAFLKEDTYDFYKGWDPGAQIADAAGLRGGVSHAVGVPARQ
jgi:hypothetical protein